MSDHSDKEKDNQLDDKKYKDEKIEKESQVTLEENRENHRIHLITIIGEIEGHENAGSQSKVTKYELLLPQLASIEDSCDIDGVLLLLNTMGGDVEADDGFPEQTDSITGAWRKSQYRCPHCSKYKLFFYRSFRDNGHSSGKNEWYGNRCSTDF